MHWYRFVPWRALPALDAGQKYRLLMQPVLMSPISTGSSNKWFLWPGSLACFLVVDCPMLVPRGCQEERERKKVEMLYIGVGVLH